MTDLAAYSLNDQFGAESGTVSLSGVQAAIRTILDQARADARVGRNVAGMVAGYRGSPVGGLDAVYERHRDLMKSHDIDFVNGVNEELGATIVWGSQQSSRHPTPLNDGVLGMWYGKGPGLDRAGDARRQAEVRARGAAGGSELTVSAARQLAKFMTYKDEYEVARLHRRPELTNEIRDQFGHDAKIDFMLQPPTLNRIGNSKKISVPERAATVMFAGLAQMKRLRGHRFDPFGNTEERRLERELIDDYQKLLADVATRLTSDNYQAAVELVGLADQVRGFSDIKLANVARYRPAVESAWNDWSAS